MPLPINTPIAITIMVALVGIGGCEKRSDIISTESRWVTSTMAETIVEGDITRETPASSSGPVTIKFTYSLIRFDIAGVRPILIHPIDIISNDHNEYSPVKLTVGRNEAERTFGSTTIRYSLPILENVGVPLICPPLLHHIQRGRKLELEGVVNETILLPNEGTVFGVTMRNGHYLILMHDDNNLRLIDDSGKVVAETLFVSHLPSVTSWSPDYSRILIVWSDLNKFGWSVWNLEDNTVSSHLSSPHW